jgi:pimeloyl-ACP methyl ester carboxylesterase
VSELTEAGTSRELQTDNGKLQYHEAGQGDPLLLLHGSGPGVSGWANFAGNIDVFAARFRTLILNLPGFGGSEVTDGHPMIDAPAAVVAFLDGLGIERCNILGNSMGGWVGANVASNHPERVDRLASIGGVGVNIFSQMPSEGIKALVDFVEEPSRPALVRWIQSMLYDQSFLTDELVERRWQQATAPGAVEWMRKMYSRASAEALGETMAGRDGPPPWLSLAHIQAPTLLLWGRDDRVSPVDMALMPMRIIPKCELHVFYDCGHWVMIERKEEFESVTLDFFGRGPTARTA